MNNKFFAFLIVGAGCLASCQKDAVKPNLIPTPLSQKAITSTAVITADTTSTAVNGYLRLQLAEDAVNTDNILINFKPSAKPTYSSAEDAPTFQGFGAVSLSSFSSDKIALAINTIPLTNKGLTIPLKVSAKSDGIYTLNMLTIQSVPAGYHLWLMDKYKKDSLDFRYNAKYAFNIFKADTTSYGSGRFKLVIRL